MGIKASGPMAPSMIERLADLYLPGAKSSNRWLRIPCPAHKGKNNSLAISIGVNGGLILKCHSRGCSYNDILEVFKRDGIEIKRTWTYPGEKRVQRTDAPGKPKRIWSPGTTKGIGLLIGNDEPGNTLAIVEGEQDYDALVSAEMPGITAASWVGGADRARDADYRAVTGRSVVVWGDNDPKGQSAALYAAQGCYLAGAEFVRIVEPVGPPGGGAANLQRKEMIQAINGATVADRPPKPFVPEPDVPVAQDGDDWVIGPVGASSISCRAHNLVNDNWQLYADLTLTIKGTVFKKVLHFSLGNMQACSQLSEAIQAARIFMPELALGSCHPTPELGADGSRRLATKIINGIFERWEHGRSFSGFIKTPSDPAPPEPGWLVEPLIADDGISIVYGQPSSGKSLLALCAALTAVTGTSFAGLKPPSALIQNVMYLDWEGSERSFRVRLDSLARTADFDPTKLRIFYLDCTAHGRLSDIRTDIARTLSERMIELVIIDSASAAGGDTLSPSEATATMSSIKSWGIPALLIAHPPKDAGHDRNKPSVYGAQAWTAAARLATFTKAEEQNEHSLKIVLRNGKAGSDLGFIKPMTITFNFDGKRLASVECSEHEARTEAKPAKGKLPVRDRLIDALTAGGKPMTIKELEKANGLDRSAISKALNDGARSNPSVFVQAGRGRDGKIWELANV